MNIEMQVSGLILLTVLMIFYLRQKKILFNTEKVYVIMLLEAYMSLLLDIASLYCIEYRQSIPRIIVELVCKAYLSSLIALALLGMIYVYFDIYKRTKRVRRLTRSFCIVFFTEVLIVFISPIGIYENSEVAYTYGPAVLATYIISAVTLVSNMLLLKVRKKYINPLRVTSVRIWMLLWILAATIQFLNNEMLLVGFAGSIGVMIVYLKLENPESNIDKSSGMYNFSALKEYLVYLYKGENTFSIISLGFNQFSSKQMEPLLFNEILLEINEYLDGLKYAKAFKLNDHEVWIVVDKADIAYDYVDDIGDKFAEGFGSNKDVFVIPEYYMIDDAKIVSDAESVINVFRYAKGNYDMYDEDTVFRIDESVVEEMYKTYRVEKLIKDAILYERVEVFYQPIYSIEEKAFTSAEALVRIRDENGNIIMPGVFIETAEKTGLIIKLGEIVFRKVCDFIKRHHILRYGLQYIEVNLSIVQCAYKELAEVFIKIMEEYQVDAEKINLEITESASLKAKKILLENMKSLSNYGVTFSLDDFGTGQSNLNYIVDMPVDIVKFDYSMTKSYFENKRAKHVMEAAVNMVHGMNLKTVAEGIETKKQHESMERLGITYIQGYYYSKPISEEELIAFLIENNS